MRASIATIYQIPAEKAFNAADPPRPSSAGRRGSRVAGCELAAVRLLGYAAGDRAAGEGGGDRRLPRRAIEEAKRLGLDNFLRDRPERTGFHEGASAALLSSCPGPDRRAWPAQVDPGRCYRGADAISTSRAACSGSWHGNHTPAKACGSGSRRKVASVIRPRLPYRAGEQRDQVLSSDVRGLGALEDRAVRADRGDGRELVSRRAVSVAARARRVGGHQAADGAGICPAGRKNRQGLARGCDCGPRRDSLPGRKTEDVRRQSRPTRGCGTAR